MNERVKLSATTSRPREQTVVSGRIKVASTRSKSIGSLNSQHQPSPVSTNGSPSQASRLPWASNVSTRGSRLAYGSEASRSPGSILIKAISPFRERERTAVTARRGSIHLVRPGQAPVPSFFRAFLPALALISHEEAYLDQWICARKRTASPKVTLVGNSL
jgi:hypothetical protein